MTTPSVRLGFFKLNVPEMEPALAFWRDAFGFTVTTTFDEDEFIEHMMTLPGQEAGPNLFLVAWKDGRDCGVGPGHGPVGLLCDDIAASHDLALAAGAKPLTGVFEAAGVKVAILTAPDGHEIELIEFPAAPDQPR